MNGRVSTRMLADLMQIKDQTGLFTAKLSVKNLLRDRSECFIRNDWRYEHRCKRHI